MQSTLNTIGTLLLYVGIVVIMLSMGFQITGEQLSAAVRRRRLMGKALLANLVLLPLVALAVSRLFAMPAEIAAGFLLASVAPGASLGPKLSEISGADLSFSVSLLFVLAVVSIVATPLIAGLILPDATNIRLDPAKVIGILIRFQLVPLVIGLAIHRWRPALAGRLRQPSIRLGNLLFFIVVAFYLIRDFPALQALPPASVAGMALMTFISLIAGWQLGGPDKGTRQALALGTSAEFTGLALLIATVSFPGTQASPAIVAFGLVMIAINTGTAVAWNRRGALQATGETLGST